MKSFYFIFLLSVIVSFNSQLFAKSADSVKDDSSRYGESDNDDNVRLHESKGKIQKRQIGVIYENDHPVGILEPFKRTYRFIPVREELLENNDNEVQENAKLSKRNIRQSKVENKRNNENTNQNQQKSGKFDDNLPNILDDMHVIENDKIANNKRDSNKNQLSKTIPNTNDHLNKREKQNIMDNKLSQIKQVDLNENYDDGGGGDDDDSEKRVERQIRNKISLLKDQVKREFETIKQQQQLQQQQQQQDSDEDSKRKKRNIENNLIDNENDSINPIKQSEGILEPLIRRRRYSEKNPSINNEISDEQPNRLKRRIDEDGQDRPQQLSDLSDSELFGALPNSFDGELSRYKRVKRGQRK